MLILSNRIKYLRELNNLSRKELSMLLFVTEQTVINYELSKRLPCINILMKLADIFSVSTDYLLGRDDYLPERYMKRTKFNLLDIEMIYQSCKKISDMIEEARSNNGK